MTAVVDTLPLGDRLLADPEAFRESLVAWLPDAPADEVVATRDQLVDVAGYVRRYSSSAQLEALRAARLTEWYMAQRWPTNPQSVNRHDDRPQLVATNCGANKDAWNRIYGVGRADRDWLLAAEDPKSLTQAAVIRANQPPREEPVTATTPTRRGSGAKAITNRIPEIAELAAKGYSAHQIAKELNCGVEHVRRLIAQHDIDVPAERILRGSSHKVDLGRAMAQTVYSLDGIREVIESLSLDTLTVASLTDDDWQTCHDEDWVTSLSDTRTALTRLINRLKEITQ